MAGPEIIPPEELSPFSTHIHNIPTEEVDFAEQYVPLRYVGARE